MWKWHQYSVIKAVEQRHTIFVLGGLLKHTYRTWWLTAELNEVCLNREVTQICWTNATKTWDTEVLQQVEVL